MSKNEKNNTDESKVSSDSEKMVEKCRYDYFDKVKDSSDKQADFLEDIYDLGDGNIAGNLVSDNKTDDVKKGEDDFDDMLDAVINMHEVYKKKEDEKKSNDDSKNVAKQKFEPTKKKKKKKGGKPKLNISSKFKNQNTDEYDDYKYSEYEDMF
jgi:hypothetical protein